MPRGNLHTNKKVYFAFLWHHFSASKICTHQILVYRVGLTAYLQQNQGGFNHTPLRIPLVRSWFPVGYDFILLAVFFPCRQPMSCTARAASLFIPQLPLRTVSLLHETFDGIQNQHYLSRMNKENLPIIHPCIKCGKQPKVETSRPEGRINDIYRLVCECGNCPLQWSVSESAAIRLWNSYVAS